MPYFDDENLNKQNDPNNNSPAQVQISGASPTTDAAGKVTDENSGQNKELNTGSNYQNLDKYVSGNNPQQFGQQFYGNVQKDVDTAKKNQTDAASQFQQQVSSASQTPTTDQVNQAIANPTSADAKQFQSWENQTYTGPHSLAESQDLNNKFWSGTQKANTNAQLAGSEPGRFTLLDSYFGRPDYGFGQKSLDNFLVQQSGLGGQQKGLQNQAAQLMGQGKSQVDQLTNAASQAAGNVANSAQNVRNAIGVDANGQVIVDPNAAGYGAIGKQYAAVNNSLTQANANRTNQWNQLTSHLASGQLTPEESQALGISNGQQLYGVDPSAYLHRGNSLTAQQVMTPEQQAQIQALSKLAGVTDTFAANPLQAAGSAYSVDTSGLQNAVSGQQAAYTNATHNTQVQNPWATPGLKNASDVLGVNVNSSPTMSLDQLRQDIAWTQNDLASGANSHGQNLDNQYLKVALPALAAAEAALQKQYLGSSVPGGNFKQVRR